MELVEAKELVIFELSSYGENFLYQLLIDDLLNEERLKIFMDAMQIIQDGLFSNNDNNFYLEVINLKWSVIQRIDSMYELMLNRLLLRDVAKIEGVDNDFELINKIFLLLDRISAFINYVDEHYKAKYNN